jgi:hypothetical protein
MIDGSDKVAVLTRCANYCTDRQRYAAMRLKVIGTSGCGNIRGQIFTQLEGAPRPR